MKIYYLNNFFVDYENVGSSGLTGISSLGKDDKITVFYTQNAQSITLDAFDMLRNSSACVEFVKVDAGEKNALDFQLATQLGFTIAENARHFTKEQPNYYIITHDKGYNAINSYWKKREVSVGLFSDLTLTVTTAEYNAQLSAQAKAVGSDTVSVDNSNVNPKFSKSKMLEEIRKIIPDPDKSNRIYTTIFSGKSKQEIHDYICKKIYCNDTKGTEAYNKVKHLF